MNPNQIKLLALDPGSHLTGYAYFEQLFITIKEKSMTEALTLIQYGLIRARQKDPFDLRCLEINAKIRNLIVEKQCTNLVLEYPQFQAGSRGMAAVRGNDTLILAFLCGSICVGWQLHAALVIARSKNKLSLAMPDLIRPSQWKGQVTKHITAKRCAKKYTVGIEQSSTDHNFTDAIMLGDFWIKENYLEVNQINKAKREDY